ncbi:MAG: 16S rRNA (cytosine(1402)-N(4))-methyltransferase, partial [Candidatus Pacebacteria bacterium CG10_big_fil_rev_8_21_14_0_10_45_6]
QFVQWEANKKVKKLYKKPLQPNETELQKNPRARSAKLRGVEKI